MENPRETSNEVFLYKVHGILGKLMPHNFPTMAQQFLELHIDNPEKLQGIVDVLFEKAICKPKCCVICARLCHCMIPTNVRIFNENGTESKLTFYQVLCRKCQKELKDVTAEEMENQEKLLEILTQEIPEEEKKLKRDDLVTEELERKAKFLKNVSFFVELFKRELVSENIMDECINTLLKSNDEESYECLCKLLSTVGKDLDHPKAKPRMDNHFDQITKAMIEHNLSPKSLSLLEDIVNLRLNDWILEEESSEPKTNISKRKRKKGHKKASRAAKKTPKKKNDDAVSDIVSITETGLGHGFASVESVGTSSIVPSYQENKDMVDNKENQKVGKGPMNMPPVLYTQQAILQQQQQQGGQPRMLQFYQRGMTRPIRIQHPQPTSQPMYQSPPGVGVQQIIQVPGGGPQQYTVSPQQYGVPQVDYQTVPVGNQPMPYRGPAPQMTGPYNQVQYQNYSASASMPPPMYAVSPSQQLMIVRGNPPMPQNMSGPPQPYQQLRQEQQPTAPRKRNIIKIRDPNHDDKDITEEMLSSWNAPIAGSSNLVTESNVSGQSSSSNTLPQESTSVTKNNESLRSVFAAQVAATLNDESESSKKSKVTIPQVATPSQRTKSTSPKSSIHTIGAVKIISIEKKNTKTAEPKKDQPAEGIKTVSKEKNTFRTVGLPGKEDLPFMTTSHQLSKNDPAQEIHMLAGSSEVVKNLNENESDNGRLMKEHKRIKLNKRLKEMDKKPDQADLMDAYTEAPPAKEEVKEEPKEDKKESKKEEPEEQVLSEEETWEDKDEKSEGMWSPEPEVEESKNGPRFYDREFLLQFQFNPVCTEKPEGLPDIEVVLQTPVTHRPPLKPSFANRGGVDFMMPSYMRQPRGQGSGQSVARSNKGRVPAKKVIHALDTKVELNKSENRWVRPSESTKHLSEDQKKTEEIIRKFRGILNKLTPQKFSTLIQQVLDLDIDTAERLEEVINIIFEKAISEPNFSVAYANMCRCLIPTNVKVESKDGKDTTLTFRKILLNKCQKEFEKEKSDEINIHEKMDELLKQGLSEEELKLKKEELDQEELKGRRRTLGNIRFIGELFKLKMLTESIMHDCIIKLLKSNDEESYECLCKLLSTIGKDLDHPKAKPRMDQYFDQMNKIIESKKVSSRCRFMLQDVRDLRESSWVPRRDDNNPKTIDQIHKEAAEQEKKTMLLIQQAKVHKRDGPSKGRDSPRTTLPQNDETWTTVPGRQRNVNVDPKKFQDVKKRTNVDTESISLGPGGRGYGAWARGSSGGSGPSSGPSTPTEQEPRGNRFSALGGDARRVPGASRQGSGAGRQESRNQGPAGRRPPQTEREKALESVRTIVQTKPQQPPKQEERETVSPRPEEPEIPATRPPTVPSPPAAKVWTEEEVEHKTMGLIDEYHNIKDLKEAIECVKEIDAPQLRYKLVFLALNHSMEKHASERVLTASLMHALLKDKIITEESYIKGLEDLLEFAEDMEIDIPHVWKYLGELIGITITDNGLPLTSLNESVEKMIKDKLKAAKLMAEVLISARSKADPKTIDLLWSQSGLSFSNFFSSKEEETQFLKKNNLESLATSSFSSSKQPQSLKVQELKIIIKESNEKVFEWIDGNVKDPKDPKFIRVLVKAVCEGCKKESDDSCDVAVFKIKSKLLQKYIDSNSSLELQALYALQALSVSLDHPPNFLKSFFNALYDEELISEDAFFEWEKDDNPNESQGKGTAKSSTVHFFEWLRSAEEEKTEG